MTIIRRYDAAELALKQKIQDTVKKADLNLSEIMALNKKFDLDLEYTPKNDVVEFTTYIKNNAKTQDSFIKECFDTALALKGGIVSESCIHSSKNSFQGNLSEALKKLKNVL